MEINNQNNLIFKDHLIDLNQTLSKLLKKLVMKI